MEPASGRQEYARVPEASLLRTVLFLLLLISFVWPVYA
jgi:hypothetical protein